VFSYFCIVNVPGQPDREIQVIAANDDAEAMANLATVARAWPGYETIVLYEGERVLSVIGNTAMGFAAEPLDAVQLGAG
jgi:hypothetical protein